MDKRALRVVAGAGVAVAAFVAMVVLGLRLPQTHPGLYLLFHTFVELFSITIACAIFVIAWNSRRLEVNSYLQFVGVAYLFAALLDTLHVLAYRGMGVFPGDSANLPTQLWVAARFLQSGALLIAPLFLGRRVKLGVIVGVGLGVAGVILLSIFYWGIFPDSFREPGGLTTFKIVSEYVICAMLVAATLLAWWKRSHFEPYVLRLVMASLVITIVSELMFTLYDDPHGAENWLGHCLKVAAFYLIYRAIVVTGLTRPFDLLFRNLQQAKAAAESANTAKDRFLAVLSHELRNPLSPVLMAVSSMSRQLSSSDPLQQDLDVIRRNVELEARLIDDLLDLTRIARGKLELSPRRVDGHLLLRHALEICQADIAAKGLQVALDLRATMHQVHADPARLQQVFWNLIKNAVKFTPEGGRITVRTWNGEESDGGKERGSALRTQHPVFRSSGMGLFIEISDTGIGIEPDVLPRIFDAFEQGNPSVTRQFGGLGLGLAISKALVERHGGTIVASSQGKGTGATFSVELPAFSTADHCALPANPEDSRPAAAAPAAPSAAAADRRLRILLVEDHADTSRLMARLLRNLEHQVSTADTVQSALQAARAHAFDLVISDLGLPDGTGLDLMRQLKAEHGLRGICISGYGMEKDIQQSRRAGFAEHITKPVDIEQLQQMIERLAATRAGDAEGSRVLRRGDR